MSTLDVVLFVIAVVGVISLGIWKSKDEKTHSDQGASNYFLAGRGLTWWLVGFSLIAANISTEQFVGMSGQSADWLGMAIASYEWMAAITLVVVAFVFLPKLLRCGLYTIPEFLEYRYGPFSRFIMALATLVILVGVPTASVIYSGAKVVSVFFQETSLLGLNLGNVATGCWLIGILAAVYVFIGGLKACAWTDLIWGSALIIGGAVVMFFAFNLLGEKDPTELIQTKVATSDVTVEQLEEAGAMERFKLLNKGAATDGPNTSGGKLHMIRPKTDSDVPWTALLLGLWIPNFFYWGLNQYIVQRTLGSKSLAEGQKGVVFAAALKLLIPFVVVIPGILCFNLFKDDLRNEAAGKNKTIIEQFEKGGFEEAIPFTPEFAHVKPGVAKQLLAHNAALVKADTPAVDPGEEHMAAGIALSNANSALIKKAEAAKIKTSAKLVGYDYDAAFGTLLRKLLKPGITWFVLAAIFGAVVSSLASMLNSASTIATMDIFAKIKKDASQYTLVTAGRVFVVIFVLIAILTAIALAEDLSSIFRYIQEFQGFISPGILSVFLFGFLIHRAPRYFGWVGILVNVLLYGALKWWIAPEMAFLNRMAVCLGVIVALGALLTLLNPLKKPVEMPVSKLINLDSSKGAKFWGIGVVIATLALYLIFW